MTALRAPLRPGFAARRPRPTAGQMAAAWGSVIEQARRPGERTDIPALAHAARALKLEGFPVADASARLMADAFLTAVRALHAAALAERRALISPACAGLAEALDRLIHDDRARRAASGWQAKAAGDDS